MATDSKIKINFLENGEYTLRETTAKTVGDLRLKYEIPANAQINVSGSIVENDHVLQNDDFVAYSSNNKVGG